jgi:hypothetical protein
MATGLSSKTDRSGPELASRRPPLGGAHGVHAGRHLVRLVRRTASAGGVRRRHRRTARRGRQCAHRAASPSCGDPRGWCLAPFCSPGDRLHTGRHLACADRGVHQRRPRREAARRGGIRGRGLPPLPVDRRCPRSRRHAFPRGIAGLAAWLLVLLGITEADRAGALAVRNELRAEWRCTHMTAGRTLIQSKPGGELPCVLNGSLSASSFRAL